MVEKGMKAERESLQRFPVYVDVPETEVSEVGGQLIKSRWIFTRKSADRVKGRIVAQQRNLGEWADTFAATPTSVGQRILLKIASTKGLVLKFGDISCAFLYAHLPPEEKIYLVPLESERKPGMVWKLLRALYGLRRSPQFFQDHFAVELEKIGFRRLLSDPQLFCSEGLQVYLLAHVDDMMIAGTRENVKKVVKKLNEIFKIKWVNELNSKTWTKFLGREWRREEDLKDSKDIGFYVRIPPTYFLKVLKDFAMEKCKTVATPFVAGTRHREDDELAIDEVKHHQYRRAVGKLFWTVGERPDLSYVIKELGASPPNSTSKRRRLDCTQTGASLHQGYDVRRAPPPIEQRGTDGHPGHHGCKLGSTSRRTLYHGLHDLVGRLLAVTQVKNTEYRGTVHM